MVYQSHKAEVEALKYLLESENISGGGPNYRDEYYAALEKLDELRLNKEASEIEIVAIEATLRDNKKIHIYSLYRPPKSKFSDYTRHQNNPYFTFLGHEVF